MEEINFLSKENKTQDKQKRQKEEKTVDLKWTEPKKDGAPIVIDKTDKLNWQEKIKKFFNFSAKDNKFTGEKGGIFKKFFIAKKEEKLESLAHNNLAGRKKILAEYGEVFNKEKMARKDLLPEEEKAIEKVSSQNSNLFKIEKEKKTEPQSNKWESPKVLKTDLVKDEETFFIDWQKNFKYLFSNLFLTFLIIGIFYSGLIYWGMSSTKQMEALNRELEILAKQIIEGKKEIYEIDAFYKKVNIIKQLLAKHIYWSNFFNFLEENTLVDVYYSGGFRGDLSGVFSLAAKAPSYQVMADQFRLFKAASDYVENVSIEKGILNIEGEKKREEGKNKSLIDFNINLTVKQNIFYKE